MKKLLFHLLVCGAVLSSAQTLQQQNFDALIQLQLSDRQDFRNMEV